MDPITEPMTERTRTAAIYARISTNETKQHIENQIETLTSYAGRMNWTIFETPYIDQGSGAKDHRPNLERLMQAAALKSFDLVLVFDLSRLTRGGPAKAFEMIERLQASGVEFWSMHEEHFRTSGRAGALFLAIAAHIAKEERLLLGERVRAGVARARAAGKTLGRPALTVDAVRLGAMIEDGQSVRAIAEALSMSVGAVHRAMQRYRKQQELKNA